VLRPAVSGDALIVDLGAPHRCLSSAVLGGGLGAVRTWLNVQVPKDYARTDPAEHLMEVVRGRALPGPVVGMLTAARIEDRATAEHGAARVVATVGVRDPLAAAGALPQTTPAVGTINVLAVLDAPLADAALVGAVATATEAKAQALAAAGLRASNAPTLATGTATDALCVACPPGTGTGSEVAFAGPATPAGHDLARAVYAAVLAGTASYRAWRAANDGGAAP
jgi:adenosylcobinamide hydrolase